MSHYSKKPEGFQKSIEDFLDDLDFDIKPDHLEDEPITEAEIAAMLDGLGDEPMSKRVTDLSKESRSRNQHRCRKESRRVPRSSLRKDAKTLRTIASFRLPSTPADQSALVEAPPTPHTDLPTPNNDNRIHVWPLTREHAKLAMANEALEYLREPGMRPVSFSLNLTPEREREALRHPKGFTDFFKRQIERDLERSGVSLPYWWFAVDIEGDRLHLHGGMLLSGNQLRAVDAALRRSGGKMEGGAAKYQLKLKLRCDHGWGTYATRNRGKVRRVIGDHMVSVSRPLNAKAEWLYGEYRRIMRAA